MLMILLIETEDQQPTKMRYTNIYSNIIEYQKYTGTSIKVGCATRTVIRTLSPLRRLRQGPSYSPDTKGNGGVVSHQTL